MVNTYTHTHTYTKPRMDVVVDQYELFLRYAGVEDTRIDKLLESIKSKEIKAMGAYLEENGYRIAEVELEIEWDLHDQLIRAEGELFDTDLGGWVDGAAPEIHMYVRRLAKFAKEKSLSIRTWIRVSTTISNEPTRHEAVCKKLGYAFGNAVPAWRNGSNSEIVKKVLDLPEMKVVNRKS